MAGPRSDQFHQRGHHVQHAHGRRAVQLAADGSHLSGCMIALMPTAADAKRLALKGGELASDLHCTLYYLGPDATVFDAEARQAVIDCVTMCAADTPALHANIFGIAHWNAGGDSPSWVWSVGDAKGTDTDSEAGLTDIHEDIDQGLDSMFGDLDDVQFSDQHTPWVAHICAAYTDDLTLAKELEKRNGPVTFDRIRVSFGSDDTDIDLTGSMTAGGVFRRSLTDLEVASKADFAMIDKQWESAVGSMMNDYSRIESDQRAQLRNQITAAVDKDDLQALESLHVDTDHAAALLLKHMISYAQLAGREMQREAESQGVRVPPWDLGTAVTASSGVDVLRSVARVTARSMGLNLVQSAARRVMSYVGSNRSGRAVAGQVDKGLKDLSPSPVREYIGAAMSAAQNTGRMAVLQAAPAGQYIATEINDKNTCGPCKTIDGTEFKSLAEAQDAYPSGGGGYANCAGGGRCRGTMIAVWDPGETAGATQEAGMVTATETLGGKPNPGTKKDKRLKENTGTYADGGCPDGADCTDPGHFTALDVIQAAWDGSASRFSDAQYKAACAACDPGQGTVKERCFLPHHDPGGGLNSDGLAAAAGRVSSLTGHDPAAVARAKSHLRSHYNTLGKPVPDNLKATEDEVAAFALEDGYDLIIWGPAQLAAMPDDCPPNMEMDPATGECVAMTPGSTSAQTAPWKGPLTVEGKATGDGREFAPEALDWIEPIEPGAMPLRWNIEDSHGGTPTTKAVNVGRIDKVWREGDMIMAEGVFDLGQPNGVEARRRVKDGFLRGISIDADDIGNADIEFVWPENSGTGENDEDDLFNLIFAQPEKVVYHGGRIRGATLCDIPAFPEAYIALTDDQGAVTAGGQLHPELVPVPTVKKRTVDGLTRALVAHGGPEWKPPAEWFTNPQLSMPTTVQVTDDGRIYGHAFQWGSCHIGFADVCTQPPREEDFPYYLTGEVITDDGKRVPVGQITVTANHADLYAASGPAKEHYENTGNAVADVTMGSDRFGGWIAGAIRPNADPAFVHELRASGEVSGDWRRIGGQHRLVGLLGVNVGGFVVPRMKARVAGGQVQALIAAGRLSTAHNRTPEEVRRQAYKIVMDDLARQMFGSDPEGSE